MWNIILAVIIVGVIGLIFGLLLSFAAVIFKVEVDEREDKILEILPGANCGACGFAGCSAYAGAVVNEGAKANLCSVGKAAVAQKIAEIMGVEAQSGDDVVARVMCNGTCDVSKDKYTYFGISDCIAASKLGGGPKSCPNGCLGLGSCLKVCKFDAIKIINGVATIDEEKCVGCSQCVSECPKHIISLVPKQNKYYVQCVNTEKGALTNKYCSVGCIGCKKCEKACPKGAIKVIDNVAKIDYSLCTACGLCAEECPKKIIKTENHQ